MSTLHLEIVTPEELKFEGDVSLVTLPGFDGEIGVLGMHAPLVTMLAAGPLMYRTNQGDQRLAVGAGFATIADNKVVCLVDNALPPNQINAEVVSKRREEIEAQLQKEAGHDDRLRGELSWVMAQLHVVEHSS